ncbi:MAG TPA: MFS transporter [Blastocatellia bacterium]|nr:MFS transporter [Blastocatellia bacterium]
MGKTVIYSLAFITLGLGLGAFGPTLPALAAQTQVEMKQISNLFVARSLGTILGSWLLGRWYDRVTGHPLLAASLIGFVAGLALMPAVTSLWVMIGLSAFMGIVYASISVGGNALTLLVHGQQARPFLSVLHFAFGVGGLCAPLIVAQFADRVDNLQITYWSLALLGLPAALLILWSPSPPLRSARPRPESGRFSAWSLTGLVAFFFLQVGAESSLMVWLFSYATGRGMETHTAAYMNSAFWATFSLSRLATVWLSARLQPATIIVSHLCILALITGALVVLPGTPTVLWMGSIGLGLAIGPIFPNILGFAQRLLQLTGKVTGWLTIGSSAAGLFWPRLIGQFFDSFGPQIMIWTVLVDILGALAVMILLISMANRAETDEQFL